LIITKILTHVKKGGYELNKEKRKLCFKKLDALAKSRNVTFYKLSEELEIPRSTFSDWKSGKSMPKTDKLIRIAEYFGVDVGYFIE
jgi:bacteriophage CI repressor helix-turn-helix domain